MIHGSGALVVFILAVAAMHETADMGFNSRFQ